MTFKLSNLNISERKQIEPAMVSDLHRLKGWRFEIWDLRMRPPGMMEVTQAVTIWLLVLIVSLPSTLNTQILDRAKMTPCKFNPFCLCSNNGEKSSFSVEKLKAAGTEKIVKKYLEERIKVFLNPNPVSKPLTAHHRPNTRLTRMSGDVCTLR